VLLLMASLPRRIPCRTCGREIEWSDQFPHRPFCSERCKLVDLGAWLSEQRAIPDDQPHGVADDSAVDEAS